MQLMKGYMYMYIGLYTNLYIYGTERFTLGPTAHSIQISKHDVIKISLHSWPTGLHYHCQSIKPAITNTRCNVSRC